MHIRVFLREFAIIFLIALAATLVVTYLGILFLTEGIIDWYIVQFSIVLESFGIMKRVKNKKTQTFTRGRNSNERT